MSYVRKIYSTYVRMYIVRSKENRRGNRYLKVAKVRDCWSVRHVQMNERNTFNHGYIEVYLSFNWDIYLANK